MHVDVHPLDEPAVIQRNGCTTVDVDGVSAGRVEEVLQGPILRVDDGALVGHDERGDLSIAGPERGLYDLLGDHLFVRHEEVEQAIGLGSAGFDLELRCEQRVQVTEVTRSISKDARQLVGMSCDDIAERNGSALVDVGANCRKATAKDIRADRHLVHTY